MLHIRKNNIEDEQQDKMREFSFNFYCFMISKERHRITLSRTLFADLLATIRIHTSFVDLKSVINCLGLHLNLFSKEIPNEIDGKRKRKGVHQNLYRFNGVKFRRERERMI